MRPFIVALNAVVSVVSVSAVCDQVDQGDQVVPAHQVDDIDEVHELDPVHQVDHKDERCDDIGCFGGRFRSFLGLSIQGRRVLKFGRGKSRELLNRAADPKTFFDHF